MTTEDWLKNTIPGIIILGAIGSVVASLAIWLVVKYVPLFAKNALRLAIRRLALHFVKPSVQHAVKLHFQDSEAKRGSFFAFQTMRFGLLLFISLCGFVSFAMAVTLQPEPLLRPSVVIALLVSFLGLWRALRQMVIMAVPLFYDIEGEITKSKDEVLKKLAEENVES